MGGFDPVSSIFSTGLMLAGQRGGQKAVDQQQAAANQAAAEQYENEARRRRSLLDREMASARARLGAMGVGGAGGSAAAVVEGLQRRSDEDMAELRQDLQRREAKAAASRPSSGAALNPAQFGLQILRPFNGGR